MEHPRHLLTVTYYTGNKEGLTAITNNFYAYSDEDINWANEIHKLAQEYNHKSILKRINGGE